MDVQEVVDAWGAVYTPEGQNEADLFIKMHEPFETANAFSTRPQDGDIWKGSKAELGRVVQPFQKSFTPTGEPNFKPLEVRQYHMKVDLELYPDELRASWLGFLVDNKLDRTKYTFVIWLANNLVLPQIKEDLEMNEIFWGQQANPTPGTAGAIKTSMNGIEFILASGISAGTIVPITTSALERSDGKLLVKQIEDYTKQIPKMVRNKGLEINIDDSLTELYQEGYDELYNPNKLGEGKLEVRYTAGKVKVVGRSSMIGSGRIWSSPKSNSIRLIKENINVSRMKIEGVDRKVKMYTDFHMGVGFGVGDYVYPNEQPATTP